MPTLCKKILISMLSILLFFVVSCNRAAPIRMKQPTSTFRTDWQNSYENYTNSLEDAANGMPGDDGGAIGKRIEKKINQTSNYGKLEAYIDSIANQNSCIIRIFNENIYFSNFRCSKRLLTFDGKKYHLFIEGVEYSDNYVDTAECIWLVKFDDNQFHFIYVSSSGKIKDENIQVTPELEKTFQSIRYWRQSRQISIPYEKKYGTIVSYWDKGNSYHVFLPWMWNDDDCTTGWRCMTQDSTVNSFHTALQNILCMAKQNGVLLRK